MANESSGAIDRFLPPDFTIFALSAPGMQRGVAVAVAVEDTYRAKDDEAKLSSFLPRSKFFGNFIKF